MHVQKNRKVINIKYVSISNHQWRFCSSWLPNMQILLIIFHFEHVQIAALNILQTERKKKEFSWFKS
jgi:uncharacterized protein YunC (DUF1805 family)